MQLLHTKKEKTRENVPTTFSWGLNFNYYAHFISFEYITHIHITLV